MNIKTKITKLIKRLKIKEEKSSNNKKINSKKNNKISNDFEQDE